MLSAERTVSSSIRSTFLDPLLQERFERDGYVVVPLLDVDEVERLRSSYDRLGAAPGDPGVACHSTFHSFDVEYKTRVDEVVRAVLAPRLETVVDRQRALPCNFIVKWSGSHGGFGLHQDLSLIDERFGVSAEVWVALDDTDEHNGQLWMIPGSHRWLPTLRGICAFPFPFASVSEATVRRYAVPVPVSKGEAVIFNHAALHFSLPNRTDVPRLVAITDLIPEEMTHLHYFGDGEGTIRAYAIGDEFWINNNPFTLWRPPPDSTLVGDVGHFEYREFTMEDLDALVEAGRVGVSVDHPKGAPNSARAWCHRCAVTIESQRPHRMVGNVTLLCDDCSATEAARATATS